MCGAMLPLVPSIVWSAWNLNFKKVGFHMVIVAGTLVYAHHCVNSNVQASRVPRCSHDAHLQVCTCNLQDTRTPYPRLKAIPPHGRASRSKRSAPGPSPKVRRGCHFRLTTLKPLERCRPCVIQIAIAIAVAVDWRLVSLTLRYRCLPVANSSCAATDPRFSPIVSSSLAPASLHHRVVTSSAPLACFIMTTEEFTTATPFLELLAKFDKKKAGQIEAANSPRPFSFWSKKPQPSRSSQDNSKSIYQMLASWEKDPSKSSSNRLNPQETNKIREALRIIQKTEREAIQRTFSPLNFTLGVFNTLLAAYMFGGYPQHFWLLVALEASILIPLKVYNDWTAKPLCQILYIIEYCWLMGFWILFSMVGMTKYADDYLTDNVRKHLFRTTVGCGTGALLGAAGVLPVVAFFFHDRMTMTALFIHATPTFLLYTFLWESQRIEKAWPGLFRFDLMKEVHAEDYFPKSIDWKDPFGTVSVNSTALYLAWLSIYILWMAAFGLRLTSRKTRRGEPREPKYDGAFQSFVRNGFVYFTGSLWGRPVSRTRQQIADGLFEIRDFIAYLFVHVSSIVFATNVNGYICFTWREGHAAFLWALTLVCIYRGAGKYVQLFTSFSDNLIHKHYRTLLEETKQS
jgi:Protein of unknown function (DUF2838)